MEYPPVAHEQAPRGIGDKFTRWSDSIFQGHFTVEPPSIYRKSVHENHETIKRFKHHISFTEHCCIY